MTQFFQGMVCHEKHKSLVAHEKGKAPIGARETSIPGETNLVFFVAKNSDGSSC
jgi:hypothetical protein